MVQFSSSNVYKRNNPSNLFPSLNVVAEIGLTKTAAAFTKDFDGVESFFMGNALKFNPFSEQKNDFSNDDERHLYTSF